MTEHQGRVPGSNPEGLLAVPRIANDSVGQLEANRSGEMPADEWLRDARRPSHRIALEPQDR